VFLLLHPVCLANQERHPDPHQDPHNKLFNMNTQTYKPYLYYQDKYEDHQDPRLQEPLLDREFQYRLEVLLLILQEARQDQEPQ